MVDEDRTVRTSFRVAASARSKLMEMSRANDHSMKDELDLIALDLFHADLEFAAALDQFILGSPVPGGARRRSQAVSESALNLICRKADELKIGRDQVVQQAILFRSAVTTFAEREYDAILQARAELDRLTAEVNEVHARLLPLLGADHKLIGDLRRIAHAVAGLAA